MDAFGGENIANPPSGSGWQLFGETAWRPPNATDSLLLPDTYFIQFEPVPGYSKPASQAVQIFSGQATTVSVSYQLAVSLPNGVITPNQIPSSQITEYQYYPYGFNGQLYTDVGYGSGVAVRGSVVLTAAHMVFNDATLNYVSQAYWSFQEEAGTFTPETLAARGWYVLSGYAAQRTNDLQIGGYSIDQSSPQSQNLDVAALYFTTPAARGGSGGYLSSDVVPNPYLTGSNLKMLVGYPVDGSYYGQIVQPETMYATPSDPRPLTLVSNNVYSASWLLSYPGNSGGPIYMNYNGYYFPAGVYLGEDNNGNALVRAINSQVVNLINLAASEGDAGTNYSGGGVITIIPSQAVSASNPGYLEFQLGPPAAVTAGAGWELSGDSSFSSATNYIRAVLTTNAFTVVFKTIPGWNVPTNQTVSVQPGALAVYNALYTAASPLQIVSPQVAGETFQLTFQSVSGQSYTLYYNNNLATTNWMPYTNVTGNGNIMQLSIPVTNTTQRFFRISQP